MKPVQVGVVGCGNISDIYFDVARKFDVLQIARCCDLDSAKAASQAAKHRLPSSCGLDELLADPAIEIVLNLTVPHAHAEVALKALQCGKSVYGEKPLAVRLEDGRQIVEQARAAGLLVGSAPDTFLGAAQQTARRAIDSGIIGRPIAANAFMLSQGVEHWHPNPEFYYKSGGGPMFDMGPYYIASLVNLLGPVKRVTGSVNMLTPQRTISSKPRAGQVIQVEVPTHVCSLLEHEGGAITTLVTSFDVKATALPNIEIYGSGATLSVPDPNMFGGNVKYRAAGSRWWKKVKQVHHYAGNSRGVGLAEMAAAKRAGRPHRASGDLGLHTLEVMHAIHMAATEGRHVDIASRPSRPEPMNPQLREWNLD